MDDLISRQAALVAIRNLYPDMPRVNVLGSLNRWREKNEHYIECEEAIKKLPSVKWKKGKWIPQDYNKTTGMASTAVYYYPKCSVCGQCANYTNFCPNCGADMRGDNQ